MLMKNAAAFALAASCVLAVSADTIVFKSGSKLDGTVVRIKDGTITFKSDDVGEVAIKQDKVAAITTAKNSTVQYQDKTTEEGIVAMNSDGYTLSGKELDIPPIYISLVPLPSGSINT